MHQTDENGEFAFYFLGTVKRIPPIGFFLVEIRGAAPCRGGVHRLHGCVRWSPIWRIWVWRAWRLSGRWPDGGRKSTVAGWTRRRAASAYTPISQLTCQMLFGNVCFYVFYLWNNMMKSDSPADAAIPNACTRLLRRGEADFYSFFVIFSNPKY